MKRKDILDMDLRTIFNPKIWLVIVAVPHTLFNVLVPLFTAEVGSTIFTGATFALLNTIVLASIYFLTEGETLSRLTAVIASSIFVYVIVMLTITEGDGFDLSAQLTPPFIYKFSFSIEVAPSLILWGLLGLSGILHWNGPQDKEHDDLEDEVGITITE